MDTHAALAGGLDAARDPRVFDATRDLTITRLLPAPPDQVFAAWTEAEQVKQWFGPYAMTIPDCAIDLRPGGMHRTLMRDAEGKDYPNRLVIEAVEPGRMLRLSVPDGDDAPPFPGAVGELAFLPDPVGTRFTARWRHPTAEMRERHETMGFHIGWGQTIDKLAAHLMRPPPGAPFPQAPLPQHGWLTRLLGEWRYASECEGPPGQAPMRATGVERVRMLGGFWTIGESEGDCPAGGGMVRMVITLGVDPGTQRFRGTFVGSMMPWMFVYDGALDEAATTLALETEGPAMMGPGTARYRDSVAMEGDAVRILSSEILQPDGSWHRFMTGRYERVG